MTKDRRLLCSVNGEDVGIVATNIPDTVYGFVDLYSRTSVKLISNVQEVRTRTAFYGVGISDFLCTLIFPVPPPSKL